MVMTVVLSTVDGVVGDGAEDDGDGFVDGIEHVSSVVVWVRVECVHATCAGRILETLHPHPPPYQPKTTPMSFEDSLWCCAAEDSREVEEVLRPPRRLTRHAGTDIGGEL